MQSFKNLVKTDINRTLQNKFIKDGNKIVEFRIKSLDDSIFILFISKSQINIYNNLNCTRKVLNEN